MLVIGEASTRSRSRVLALAQRLLGLLDLA